MTSLNVRIPEELADRLSELASQTGRTKSYYIRTALEQKLEELEDYFLAMQALENVNSGKSRLWKHEEIEQENDLGN